MSTYTGGKCLELIIRLLLSFSEPPSDLSSSEFEEALVEVGNKAFLSLNVDSGEAMPEPIKNPVLRIINLTEPVIVSKLENYLDLGSSASNELSPLLTLANI